MMSFVTTSCIRPMAPAASESKGQVGLAVKSQAVTASVLGTDHRMHARLIQRHDSSCHGRLGLNLFPSNSECTVPSESSVPDRVQHGIHDETLKVGPFFLLGPSGPLQPEVRSWLDSVRSGGGVVVQYRSDRAFGLWPRRKNCRSAL
jgi:hypothetical protein